MTRTELTELVIQAQKGDNSAIEQIYLLTHNSVFNKIYGAVNNADDAEDILQSCYLTLIEKIGELKEPESFEKWFNTIVANKVKDHKKKKAPVLLDGSEYNALSNFEENDSVRIPHESIERSDNIETIRKLISELSDKNRESIEMHYIENKSVSEIADELGVSENTVKTRLYNGRNEIKKKAKINAKKILITILILILLAIITVFSVFGSNEIFSKLRYSFSKTHLSFQIHDNYLHDYPETIEEVYTLYYLPEGFELCEPEEPESDTDVSIHREVYQRGFAEIVLIQLTFNSRGTNDSENAETSTIIVNDSEVLHVKNSLGTTYTWDNSEYIFVLNIKTTELSFEEEIKILENIAPKNPQ